MKTPDIIEALIGLIAWTIALGGTIALLLSVYIAFRLNGETMLEVFSTSEYRTPACPECKSEDVERVTLSRPKQEVEKCGRCGYTARREEFENGTQL